MVKVMVMVIVFVKVKMYFKLEKLHLGLKN